MPNPFPTITGGVHPLRVWVYRFMEAAHARSEWDAHPRRRAQRRYHRSWPILVTLDGEVDSAEFSAALHNASPGGIAFLTTQCIDVDTRLLIKLFWHDPQCPRVPAIVRHTTEVSHGFLTGCQFLLDQELDDAIAPATARAWYE